MKPASSGLAQYNNNLRHVLLNSTSNSATQAVRTDMFRASLVDNPLGEQKSINKAITTSREREHLK
ncbi:MAG: hypothetical protein CBC34_001655 [Hyphomicrobiaceae bacterium TMED74]|nr:hypothetical protein [Filomicrobium sp.]RPG47522.1 MAG: hypothetical protein CBC34_001655 [Hyphomicrobiaceae bacterium TMED74]